MSGAGRGSPIPSEEIRAAVSGDRDALASLSAKVEAAAKRMLGRLRRRIPSGARVDWEDLCQVVMLRVTRHLPRFRGTTGGQLINWLRELVRNCFADAICGQPVHADGHTPVRPLEDSTEALEVPDSRPQPSEEAISTEQLEILWRAVGGLPDRDRFLIQLRIAAELPFDELARRLGYPSGTAARSAYWRAVHSLPALIARLRAGDEEGGAEFP
jgi:RNA polymerase sigma-70 factor (ECF subfamily)